ncbi:MAG: hypothetical protein RID23_08680 [Roseovarius sp.]|nr:MULTISPECIES: hypothetical protein [unclassified Roseovarius]
MIPALKMIAVVLISALGISFSLLPNRATAQSYPIDCAILLCLSGGWPSSEPCALARAEFIRRITPWPVEPPLQIWRCPMGASFEPEPGPATGLEVLEARSKLEDLRLIRSPLKAARVRSQLGVFSRGAALLHAVGAESSSLRLVQDRADIDIGGPEFDFVRSIRVFDVRYASQRLVGEGEVCRRYASVYLGTYGRQGGFSWHVSSPEALPSAHSGLEGWGKNCPQISNRSVFVDWRDFDGNYGFEQVAY